MGVCVILFCKSQSWQSCHIPGSLTALHRGRRRFTDLSPNIKWINQEWRVEVVININEVF